MVSKDEQVKLTQHTHPLQPGVRDFDLQVRSRYCNGLSALDIIPICISIPVLEIVLNPFIDHRRYFHGRITMRLILASGSPRREEILRKMGMAFEVIIPNIDEKAFSPIPEECAVDNAFRKAEWIAQEVMDGIIIGADTIVVLGDRVFNKPRDDEEAIGMLETLSGRTHRVITGIAVLLVRDGNVKSKIMDYEVTRVKMKPLERGEIERYVKECSPLDKAGSYAVQEIGDRFVEGIEGDYHNVVGLPKEKVKHILDTLFSAWK